MTIFFKILNSFFVFILLLILLTLPYIFSYGKSYKTTEFSFKALVPLVTFLSMSLVIVSISYFYLSRKLFKNQNYSKKIKITIQLFLVLLTFSPIFGLMITRFFLLTVSIKYVLSWIFYTSFGFLSFLILFFLISDFFKLVINLSQKIVQNSKKSVKSQNNQISRRDFFKLSTEKIVFSTAFLTSGIAIYEARKLSQVESVSVFLKNLPPAWENTKIVQISDVHIGNTIMRGFLESIVEKVNSLNPDIITITGDMVDGSVKQLRNHTNPLQNLSSTYGTYFITGNHEYYSGALFWLDEFDRIGLKNLVNSHEILEKNGQRLILAGVNDYTAHRFIPKHKSNPFQALKGTKKNDVKILLAHQPKSIFSASKAGVDLQLSGHTHGGQFFPYNYLVDYMHPYVRGLHLHENKTWIYVNRGTGYWGIPMRLGSPSEITLLRLKKGKKI